MVNREIYPALSKEITTKEILVLTGPRQVGKTTAVRWLINNVKNSIYIDLTLASARELFIHKDYNNIILSLENEGLNFGKHVTIAIDEIQYVKNLPEIVKYLYDNYDIKFILTGSSAYYLKNHFNESLAGRKLIYELYPLTFKEFLDFNEVRYNIPNLDLESVDLSEYNFDKYEYDTLRTYYEEYINYGGFPAVVKAETIERKRQLLDEIYSSYINLDVQLLADFKSISDLKQLICLLGARVGSQINIDELSKILGLSRQTVTNYISFLEQTYLIKLLPVYTKNTDVRERTPKKVYFIDNGIVNINADISGGAKFENSIHMQLLKYGKLYFYNVKDGEIDFILKTYDSIFAFEVKETPTDKYLKTLNRRAAKLDIEKISLIGRYPIATFSNYIWGARI